MNKIQYQDNTRIFQFPEIETVYPIYKKIYPENNDYENGFFERFFVKKINDKSIYEVSKDNYFDISPNLYIRIVLRWKLTGKRNDVFNNNIKLYEGVYEYNNSQIIKYKQIMPGLENVLRDPLEFWKPN